MSSAGWLPRAQQQLRSLRGPLGGCRQPPTADALTLADAVLRQLSARGIKATRIAPHADGGVSVHFSIEPAGNARVSFDNDGSCGVLVTRAHSQAEPVYSKWLPGMELPA